MSPGITLSVHFWRGWGRDEQKDLFYARRRFGFITLSVDRADVLPAYWKLRRAIEDSIIGMSEGL